MTLFPALAANVPGGGAQTLGWISAASGFGALAGALYLARRKSAPVLGWTLGISSVVFSCGLMLLAQATRLHGMLCFAFVSAFGMMLFMACGNTIIQTVVEDDKRGRVMSFFTFSLLGLSPFGGLLMGAAAQRFGIKLDLFFQGILCLLGSFWFLRKAGHVNAHISGKLNSVSG